MDKQTVTDTALKAKALSRWENEGGAPIERPAETVEPRTAPRMRQPETPAAEADRRDP